MKEENTRLRQQLEARASGSVPPPSLAHSQSRPTLPSLLSQASIANATSRPDSSHGGYPPQAPPGAHAHPEPPYAAAERERERDELAKHSRENDDRWANKGKGKHIWDSRARKRSDHAGPDLRSMVWPNRWWTAAAGISPSFCSPTKLAAVPTITKPNFDQLPLRSPQRSFRTGHSPDPAQPVRTGRDGRAQEGSTRASRGASDEKGRIRLAHNVQPERQEGCRRWPRPHTRARLCGVLRPVQPGR